MRWIIPCLISLAVLLLAAPVRAQESENPVEQAALRAHLQNRRTHAYTDWIGGPLGDAASAPGLSILGDTLDRWELDGLAGDDGLTAGDLARPTLLNFWASWCYPCQLEFPHLSDAALNPHDHAFDIVFVNVWDTSRADAEAYLALYSPDLHTVIDPGDRLARRALIAAIPTSILLDTDGTVLAVHNGLVTPTIIAFLDAVSANPGEGQFIAAEYADRTPQANLLPVELANTPPITYGQPVTGTITAADPQDAYQFEGRAGDELLITLSASAGSQLDSYVALLTADGERIAENDDIDPGVIQNSRLAVTLPDHGTYIIVATRFLEDEGYAEGEYELLVALEIGPTDQPAAAQLAGTITYGETVTGTISDASYEQHWTFTGVQGDVISAAMHRADQPDDAPGGLDGVLQLIGPDGDLLVEADDSLTVMPVIETYELPANGTYTLIATRFALANGFSEGAYTLTLERIAAAPDNTVGMDDPTPTAGTRWFDTPPGTLRWIAYNEPVSGTLADDAFDDWYTFRGTAGDVISIRMDAPGSDLDPFLLLTDEHGTELARSDDASGGSRDAAITDFALPASGTYLIRATRYGLDNGPSQGAYTLVIDTDAAAPAAANIPTTAITLGEIVTGSLSLDQPRARYTFEAAAGDWVTVAWQRTSGDLGVEIDLYDPAGELFMFHPGSLYGDEARIDRVELPTDGTYRIELKPDNDLDTSGSYQLIVLPAAPVQVDPGAFVPADGLDVEIVLIWDSGVDLDLSVPAAPAITGEQTVHANDFCAEPSNLPVERFTKEVRSTWRAHYAIHVTYRLNCTGQREPVNFLLAIAVDGEVVDIIGGTLTREGDTYTTHLFVAP